jgi:hypothetical protein
MLQDHSLEQRLCDLLFFGFDTASKRHRVRDEHCYRTTRKRSDGVFTTSQGSDCWTPGTRVRPSSRGQKMGDIASLLAQSLAKAPGISAAFLASTSFRRRAGRVVMIPQAFLNVTLK